MTPRLFLRAAAKADLREAFEGYEARSTGLGFEVSASRTGSVGAHRAASEQFAIALDDIRRAHLLRFPYAVYYLIEGERVVVIACAHGRQHPRRCPRSAGQQAIAGDAVVAFLSAEYERILKQLASGAPPMEH